MNNRRVLATTALTASAALAFAPLATAQQQEPKLEMPATVANGQSISAITGPCETFSTITSPGFREPITLFADGTPNGLLRGYGPTTIKAGTYTATVTCDGKTLTAQFTVLPLEINWYLHPTEVQPGGTITAGGDANTGCSLPGPPNLPIFTATLNSPGFAAPLKFTRGGNLGRFSGDTTVISTPGTYEVVWQCADRPERSVKTFRILGTPPAPPGKPKPPITKPKGAPDTGGGGTA